MDDIINSKLKQIESEIKKYQKKVEENIDKVIEEKDKIKEEILSKARELQERMEHLNIEKDIEKIKNQVLELAPKKIAEIKSLMEKEIKNIPPLPDIPDIMDLAKKVLTSAEPPEIPNITPIKDFINNQIECIRKSNIPSLGELEIKAKEILDKELSDLKKNSGVINKALDTVKQGIKDAPIQLNKLTDDIFDKFEKEYQVVKGKIDNMPSVDKIFKEKR